MHLLALVAVWVALATSGIVFSEPAPTDILSMGLLALLPVIGLVAITPMLLSYLSLWMVAGAAGLLAATMAPDLAGPAKFTFVTLYLYIFSFVVAAFVARAPQPHVRLIFSAWTFAALIAAAAGIVGYFSLVPGTFEAFTKFGRAAGTFKDPNVFGPFLVAPFLYALNRALDGRWRDAAVPMGIATILALGVLLSFSRGAWMCLAAALMIYGWLSVVTARDVRRRRRIVELMFAGAAVVALVVLAALQSDSIIELLSQRASLAQSYDVGPEGRFGGQEKAIGLILDNPFGIGATVFADVHHHEEVHNVYLSMLLNAGWLGGGLYLLMTLLTLGLGLRHALVHGAAQPVFLVAYAAFAANALEGAVIDIDHWRHVYLLMAVIWGLMAASARNAPVRTDGARH